MDSYGGGPASFPAYIMRWHVALLLGARAQGLVSGLYCVQALFAVGRVPVSSRTVAHS